MSYSLNHIIEIHYDYQFVWFYITIIEINYTIINFGKRHSDNINININRNGKITKSE